MWKERGGGSPSGGTNKSYYASHKGTVVPPCSAPVQRVTLYFIAGPILSEIINTYILTLNDIKYASKDIWTAKIHG